MYVCMCTGDGRGLESRGTRRVTHGHVMEFSTGRGLESGDVQSTCVLGHVVHGTRRVTHGHVMEFSTGRGIR